jgi:CheY-like chemotaxis protein
MPVPVLVVDDDSVICAILVRHLSASGYEAHSAGDGVRALELAAEREYAAIFIDFELPHDNGVRVMQRLRQVQPRAAMVMTSGWNPPTLLDELKAANLEECQLLPKPWSLEQVLAIVTKAAVAYQRAG